MFETLNPIVKMAFINAAMHVNTIPDSERDSPSNFNGFKAIEALSIIFSMEMDTATHYYIEACKSINKND